MEEKKLKIYKKNNILHIINQIKFYRIKKKRQKFYRLYLRTKPEKKMNILLKSNKYYIIPEIEDYPHENENEFSDAKIRIKADIFTYDIFQKNDNYLHKLISDAMKLPGELDHRTTEILDNSEEHDKIINKLCEKKYKQLIEILINEENKKEFKNLTDKEKIEKLYKKVIRSLAIDEKINIILDLENEDIKLYILKLIKEMNLEKRKIIKKVCKYEKIVKKIKRLKTDEDKTEFILSIDDNYIKIELLKYVNLNKNRDRIINSLKCTIDPELKNRVQLAQEMITEFCEDLSNNFDKEKQENMEMAFFSTDVRFFTNKEKQKNLRIKGYAKCIKKEISIKKEENIKESLYTLIHEYGHMFNLAKVINLCKYRSNAIDEGTQDLFAEMVINHYIEKHGHIIIIDGKKIKFEYPVINNSGYYFENAWQRTLLYPLQEEKKDIDTLIEYQLGDKNKYIKMVFQDKILKKIQENCYTDMLSTFSQSDIYNSSKAYKKINKDSIYYRRNWLLAAFQLQNRLNEKGVNVNILDNKIDSIDLAKKYFKGKRIDEIESQELEEFIDLYFDNDCENINGEDLFENYLLYIKDTAIPKKTFTILKNLAVVKRNVPSLFFGRIDVDLIFNECIEIELKKISEGQSLEETFKKFNAVKSLLKKPLVKQDEPMLNLQLKYLEQIEKEIQNDKNKVEETIKVLTEKGFNFDKSIVEFLKKYGIEINDNLDLKLENSHKNKNDSEIQL